MSDSPPPTPPAPAPAPAPAAPAKSGNRVLIIIVCVIFGFVLLVGGCVATCTYIAAKKAREFTRSAQRNPVYASLSLAASLNPEVDVLSKDETSGKITVRNKRTGETVIINANDYTQESIGRAIEKMTQAASAAGATASRAAAEPAPVRASGGAGEPEPKSGTTEEPKISAGKAAAMSAILKGFPAYVPAYPGGMTLEASQNALGGNRAGNYVFVSTDKLEAVVDFYEKRATAAGFTVLARNGDSNDFGPTLSLSLMHTDPQGTITLNAETKEGGRVQVSIGVAEMGK